MLEPAAGEAQAREHWEAIKQLEDWMLIEVTGTDQGDYGASHMYAVTAEGFREKRAPDPL